MTAPLLTTPVLFAASACLTTLTALTAQDLGFASVIARKDIAVSVGGLGVKVPATVLPAGTDVLAGLDCSSSAPGGSAGIRGAFRIVDQSLAVAVDVGAIVNGAVLPGGYASAGDALLDLHLQVPRAMRVRFELGVAGVSSPGIMAGRASIDVVGHGGLELGVAKPGYFREASKELVLDLPAGLTVVGIQVAAAVPMGAIGTDCAETSASATLTISPAQVEVADEAGGCGSALDLTPMLDGQSVRCYVGAALAATAALVCGVDTTNVTLPLAPGCALLVDPMIVLPLQPGVSTTVQVSGLGPIDLYVQGVTLTAASPWSAPGLLASHRATVTVH